MRITLITSNKNRHNYLINLLSTISDELFVIQECKSNFPETISDHYSASASIKKYFESVNEAETKLFRNSYLDNSNKNIKILPMIFGDLMKCSIKSLSEFLKSDAYIIFGSSHIKGELLDFLVKQRAINIHMGVSPYYRGTDCNFWALYDDNPHLVGATIHLLSRGLDSGPMLYHAMSNIKTNPFEYSMSTVKAAFYSVVEKIKDNSIFEINPAIQDKNKEIRYSRKSEFTEEIVKKYFEKKIALNSKQIDVSLLKEPFFLNN
jgi:hypothetical protein